jgi:transcriptional regulator with GAF, ATPase, and Fis domain/ligand-binding sensor domain-containing protein
MNNIIHKYLFSFTLVWCLVTNVLYAQQYPFTHYTKDRGLPGNQIWSIFQDTKGYMWFSTSAGLIKYNGKEYKFYGKAEGVEGNFQLSITEDFNNEAIWSAFSRGVNRIKDKEIKTWNLSDIEDRFKLFADKSGRIWIYSNAFSGNSFFFQNDSLYNFSEMYDFKDQLLVKIIEDTLENIFFITRNGKIFKLSLGVLSEINIVGLANTNIKDAFFDAENNLIICTTTGVGVVTDKKLDNNSTIRWIIKKHINYGIQSSRGYYWFASNEGLFRIKDLNASKRDFVHITENNGLLSNNIEILFEDYEANLWIGYSLKGISKLSTLMFRKYGKENGFNVNAILSISKIDDKLFCATEKGLFTFNIDTFSNEKIFQQIDPGIHSTRTFMSMLPLSAQEILLGSTPGLYSLKNSKINYLDLNNSIVRTIMRDQSSRLWIGTHKGIYIQKENTFVKQDFGVSDKSINKLLEVNGKDLFIATDKGLYIVENGTLSDHVKKNIRTPEKDDLPSDLIYDLLIDTNDNIIFGSTKGVGLLNGKRIAQYIEDLKNHDGVVLHMDKKKRLWVGTNTGLFVLVKNNNTYEVKYYYSQQDGLASDEFTLNNTFYEEENGKIYIGSFNGLTIFDPSEDFLVNEQPKIYITNLEVNDTISQDLKDKIITLSPGQNKIAFYYEALSFFNEDAVKFEYYLFPIEEEWSKITANPKISFGYLEAGDYTFHVRAINQFGIKSLPKEISFKILAPFWKQPWFVFFLIILLVFAGYQVNHQRQRHIRKRNKLLEEMVEAKTQQLKVQNHQLLEAQKELVEKRELEKAHKEIQLLKDKLSKENIYLRERQGIINEVSSILGKSSSIQKIRNQVVEIAATNAIVLITGETGVGKNLVAEAIHNLSPRKDRTLISVNCAAIPEPLVESELFGHEKGAFTGAFEKREGKFEIADGSTIFLDEIGDMPLNVQAKVLTVLQSQKFMRVGGKQQISTNVRIIAATNQNLESLVEHGHFRQDLLYRVNLYKIHIPPLSDRPEDIEPLAKYFMEYYAKMLNKKINSVTKSALKKLHNYKYPGNTRELENIIHRALIICKGEIISDEDIILEVMSNGGKAASKHLLSGDFITLDKLERDYIIQVLEKTKWKISGKGGAAEILGLHYSTLRFRMEKLEIPFKAKISNN